MCEPMMMMSVLGQGVGLMGQMAQSQQQDAYYEQNRQNALRAFEDNNRALNLREQQEMTSAADQRFDNSLQTRAAIATATVSAGEAGIGGISVDNLLTDFSGRGDRANDRISQQTDWNLAQVEAEKTGAADTAVSRINSVQKGDFGPLNFLDAAVRIGTAGINSATQQKRNSLNGLSL